MKTCINKLLNIFIVYDTNEKNENLLRRIDALITTAVQEELKKQLAEDLQVIFAKQKTMKADCLELYANFDKFNHKKWEEYINSLTDKAD